MTQPEQRPRKRGPQPDLALSRPLWSQRLRAARLAAGLSVAELAERAELSPRTVENYDSGRTMPLAPAALALARALGSTVEVIFGE